MQNHYTEPLLNIADYLCWAVQRIFERGETRYYNFIQEKIKLVVDLYDSAKYENSRNYYTNRNPLTAKNKKAHISTKKVTLQRHEVDVHARQAIYYTILFTIMQIFFPLHLFLLFAAIVAGTKAAF